MTDVIETAQVKAAVKLTQAVMASEQSKIGRITGEPGTGKTMIGHYLVEHVGGVRLCVHAGMNNKGLMAGLCWQFGIDDRGTVSGLLMRLARHVAGRLIVIDEANHLQWNHIETLRYLPDEAGAGLILIGTDLLERSFHDGRSAVYLRQMAGRIGSKQLRLTPMSGEGEITKYVLEPAFGQVSKTTAKEFMKGCGGYWRLAHELKEACVRIMQAQEIASLDETVVHGALSYIGAASARKRVENGQAAA